MNSETWHKDFNPSKFLGSVNLDKLIERNKAFNESHTTSAKTPCIMCNANGTNSIILNDQAFLCQQCFSKVATISYPEKYEILRRDYLVAKEARRLAWGSFSKQFEYKAEPSSMVLCGWLSLFLMILHPAFVLLTVILLIVGYLREGADKAKCQEWHRRKVAWEENNPEPSEPTLKHFHDPEADLSIKDKLILRIFDHWPGYPPFWQYLRSIVLAKDSFRCQVTGCPSRLELHVHHVHPVSLGGSHAPDNLVSLCDFHHALEPEKGHERIWANVKTRYFTLVCEHERANRATSGMHDVRAHLRRLQLVTADELKKLNDTYNFACPLCGDHSIRFTVQEDINVIQVKCPSCSKYIEGPQQLTEETGPRLAELLKVNRNGGRWKPRWDMLSERTSVTWGTWAGIDITARRREFRERVEEAVVPPMCPKCGIPMRIIRPKPQDRWQAFWGCRQFPICRGSNPYAGR